MNTIYKHFIDRNDDAADLRIGYSSWFLDTFPCSEFDQDDRLFWHFLDYCNELNVPAKFKYLQAWLETDLRFIMRDLSIRVPGCEALSYDDPLSFETAVRITKEVLEDDFKVLESYQSEVLDFKVDMSTYMSEQRKTKLTKTLANTYEKLNGTDDTVYAAQYCADEINIILTIYNEENLRDLDERDGEQADKLVKVGAFGIPAIDADAGGLYTTRLYDVSAQPGKGKTRFAIGQIVYIAITVYKTNVLMILLEQTVAEAEAMLVAHHVFIMFNIQISDSMILNDEVPEELKSQVEAARYDLFKSGKYGKVKFSSEDLYVETFESRLNVLDRLFGPFEIVIMDYVGLMESKPAKYQSLMKEWEILKLTYRRFKRWLLRTRKAGVSITQFTKEGTQAGRADKEITADMLQGGMAASRNIDYGSSISSTESMDFQQKRRISNTKSRYSKGFAPFLCDVRLGFCYFKQIPMKES